MEQYTALSKSIGSLQVMQNYNGLQDFRIIYANEGLKI